MTVIPLLSCPQRTQCSLSSLPTPWQRKLWAKADQVALGEPFAVPSSRGQKHSGKSTVQVGLRRGEDVGR